MARRGQLNRICGFAGAIGECDRWKENTAEGAESAEEEMIGVCNMPFAGCRRRMRLREDIATENTEEERKDTRKDGTFLRAALSMSQGEITGYGTQCNTFCKRQQYLPPCSLCPRWLNFFDSLYALVTAHRQRCLHELPWLGERLKMFFMARRTMTSSAENASVRLILDWPSTRSTKVIGVSLNRQPTRFKCQSTSSWKE